MTEYKDDEPYDPEEFPKVDAPYDPNLAVNRRIVAADIASRIPWNAAEPATVEEAIKRFEAVLNWLEQKG